MGIFKPGSREAEVLKDFVRRDFQPYYGEVQETFDSHPKWRRLRELGTELWLDTGDPEEISSLWTREFNAVTTNNTLLNKEVQKGTYDDLIPEAKEFLNELGCVTPDQLRLELAFILNAVHGLKLVQQFDAYVSVEEHTDLANDMEAAIMYARRYHAICPERFFVKLPLSPAGILATRKLAAEGIPVNHTLGFSARQNYLVTRIAQPAFVNVFLGRLNSFVADNELGDGSYVGERTTLASQRSVRQLRSTHGIPTRQIGASLRDGNQVRDLAGIEVLTMPGKAAKPFRDMDMAPEDVGDCSNQNYEPPLADGIDAESYGLSKLWDVPESFTRAVERLAEENLDAFTQDDLVSFMEEQGFADLFPGWTEEQIQTSAEEGKIPDLQNWEDLLKSGTIGLDAIMNMAALNSFIQDQKAMDERIMSMIETQRRQKTG